MQIWWKESETVRPFLGQATSYRSSIRRSPHLQMWSIGCMQHLQVCNASPESRNPESASESCFFGCCSTKISPQVFGDWKFAGLFCTASCFDSLKWTNPRIRDISLLQSPNLWCRSYSVRLSLRKGFWQQNHKITSSSQAHKSIFTCVLRGRWRLRSVMIHDLSREAAVKVWAMPECNASGILLKRVHSAM